MLSKMGASVGIVDCDVYGPSLPSLIPIDSSQGVRGDLEGALIPLEHHNVKLMSYGYIKTGDFAALRGPLASGLVEQMISGTNWGNLDYLILDLPPGTGDIHLTIGQSVKVTAAVLVTTPQTLSVVDVIKGVKFFNELRIPTIAVVENMSYFKCGNCDFLHQPFSKSTQGLMTELRSALGVVGAESEDSLFIRFPIDERIAQNVISSSNRYADEKGESYPLVFALEGYPEGKELLDKFVALASRVTREVSVLKFRSVRPEVSVSGNSFNIAILKSENSSVIDHEWALENEEDNEDDVSEQEAEERRRATAPKEVLEVLQVPCRIVRLACRCGECVDERSGQSRIVARKIPMNIKPVTIEERGNFAIHVVWTDGHTSIMGYSSLEKLARESLASNSQKGGLNMSCAADPSLDW
eukprot:GDKJ01007798.1.p1 GENE.GDKJ01007798.1~~GDKJ01007798.1.p1  ORF type:complete len:412 (-),score=92.84 GDKJ01007798.1:72-1307(-)